jgi:hypothetical protein
MQAARRKDVSSGFQIVSIFFRLTTLLRRR